VFPPGRFGLESHALEMPGVQNIIAVAPAFFNKMLRLAAVGGIDPRRGGSAFVTAFPPGRFGSESHALEMPGVQNIIAVAPAFFNKFLRYAAVSGFDLNRHLQLLGDCHL